MNVRCQVARNNGQCTQRSAINDGPNAQMHGWRTGVRGGRESRQVLLKGLWLSEQSKMVSAVVTEEIDLEEDDELFETGRSVTKFWSVGSDFEFFFCFRCERSFFSLQKARQQLRRPSFLFSGWAASVRRRMCWEMCTCITK